MVMKCHEYTAAHGGRGRVVNCEVHAGPAPANTFLKQKGLQLAEVSFSIRTSSDDMDGANALLSCKSSNPSVQVHPHSALYRASRLSVFG